MVKFVQVHRFIVSGRHAGRGRKQRQQASESLGRAASGGYKIPWVFGKASIVL